jgi:hypothetical protein
MWMPLRRTQAAWGCGYNLCQGRLRPQLTWDVAEVLRSNNASPYDTSIDLMFYSEAAYHIVKDSSLLTDERLRRRLV